MTSRHLKYVDLSLSRIREFCKKLGNIQDKIPNIIHVAGTNGKGSTIAFLRTILEHHNYAVNVFTSPHLVNYRERFRLHGHIISENYLKQVQAKLEKIASYASLTMFEAATVEAFVAFAETKADFCIFETGLGGRLDATNIIKCPRLSLITKLGLDHEAFLGNKIAGIAYEKACIIKPNSTAITCNQPTEAFEVIKDYSQKVHANFIAENKNYFIKDNTFKYNNYEFSLQELSLVGDHQKQNAALALAAAANLINLEAQKVYTALNSTFWPGRMQKVTNLLNVNITNNKLEVFLDGAHNEDGAKVLNNFLNDAYKKNNFQRIILALGMLKSKNIDSYLVNLSSDLPISILPLIIDNHESYSEKEVILHVEKHNFKIINNSLHNLLMSLNYKAKEKTLVVVTGSLYLLGEIINKSNISIT